MGTLTDLQLCRLINNNVTVYYDTTLWEPALSFCRNCNFSSSSIGSDYRSQSCSPHASMSLAHDAVTVHLCSFLGPSLVDTENCGRGTNNRSCSFGAALTWMSSHHDFTLVKLS
ncbi:hypothetical protein ILYODFUR_012597 [Ilyodon furcidens]|uniref:Uncharacterized protein n=1 Tax=Ilyodon furcidens TaxID=33524 RepID=A0ABV0T9S9_9TELE